MNLLRVSFACCFASSVALAASNPPVGTPAKSPAPAPSQWVFSLLPKSLQNNPTLDLTVITEVSEEGKKLPPVSPDHPAYYLAQTAGYVQVGDSSGNQKTLSQDDIERLLKKSLAANGYLPATPPAQPPSLVVFYSWGTDNLLNPDDESHSADMVARNILDRAAMVGGAKFAREMAALFQQAAAMAMANPPARTDESGNAIGGNPVLDPGQMEFFNPVYLYKQRNPKNEFLVDQAADDCYYVVASAYDYAAFAHQQKKLLWRTRMTVNARGITQVQSLPTLIASAAPYFGRDMLETEVIVKRARQGEVIIGTPTVVELPAAAPTKK